MEVIQGHIHDLLEKEADYIFMPFIVDNKADKQNHSINYNCPWIQSYPFMVRGAMKEEWGDEMIREQGQSFNNAITQKTVLNFYLYS